MSEGKPNLEYRIAVLNERVRQLDGRIAAIEATLANQRAINQGLRWWAINKSGTGGLPPALEQAFLEALK